MGSYSLMIEMMALLVPIAQVKTAGKVKKACQHIFGHGSSVGEPAGGCHQDIGVPKIGIQKVACPRRKLMDPFQARRVRSQILEWWPADQHDLKPIGAAIALIGRLVGGYFLDRDSDPPSTATKWREAPHRTIP